MNCGPARVPHAMHIDQMILDNGALVYRVREGDYMEVARFSSRLEAERYVASPERLDRTDRRRGRDANLANQRRDPKQNIDWLAGWDDAEDDRRCLDRDPFRTHPTR
jgi:hypothetical protein